MCENVGPLRVDALALAASWRFGYPNYLQSIYIGSMTDFQPKHKPVGIQVPQ